MEDMLLCCVWDDGRRIGKKEGECTLNSDFDFALRGLAGWVLDNNREILLQESTVIVQDARLYKECARKKKIYDPWISTASHPTIVVYWRLKYFHTQLVWPDSLKMIASQVAEVYQKELVLTVLKTIVTLWEEVRNSQRLPVRGTQWSLKWGVEAISECRGRCYSRKFIGPFPKIFRGRKSTHLALNTDVCVTIPIFLDDSPLDLNTKRIMKIFQSDAEVL